MSERKAVIKNADMSEEVRPQRFSGVQGGGNPSTFCPASQWRVSLELKHAYGLSWENP